MARSRLSALHLLEIQSDSGGGQLTAATPKQMGRHPTPLPESDHFIDAFSSTGDALRHHQSARMMFRGNKRWRFVDSEATKTS
jgi:hypothetical protein